MPVFQTSWRRVATAAPALVALLAFSCLPGCGGGTTAWLAGESGISSPLSGDGPQPLVGRAQWLGETSRAQAQSFLVARTEDEWAALWDLAGRPAPGKLPDGLMALGIFLGTRTSTGYSVDVIRLRAERDMGQRDRMVVEFREKSPAEGQITAQMLTSPYAIIMVDRSDANVRYNRLP